MRHDTQPQPLSQEYLRQTYFSGWPISTDNNRSDICEPPPLIKSDSMEYTRSMVASMSPPTTADSPRHQRRDSSTSHVTSPLASPLAAQPLPSPRLPLAAQTSATSQAANAGQVLFSSSPAVIRNPLLSPPPIHSSPTHASMQTASPSNWYPPAAMIASPNQPAMHFIHQQYPMGQSLLASAILPQTSGVDPPNVTMATVMTMSGTTATAIPVASGDAVPHMQYTAAPAGTVQYASPPLILHRMNPAAGPQFIQLATLPLTPGTIRQTNTCTPDSGFTESSNVEGAMAIRDGIDNDVGRARERRLYPDSVSDPAAVRLPSGRIAYSCRTCKLTYLWRRHLEQHFTSHRSHRKPTLCHICGKCFPRPDHVNRHASSRHTTVVYPCQLCGQEFARIYNLHKHWRDQHPQQVDRVNEDSPSDSTSASEEDAEDAIKSENQSEDVDVVTMTSGTATSPLFSPSSDKPLNAMFSQLLTAGSPGSAPSMELHAEGSPSTAMHKMSLAPMRRGVRGAPNLPRRFACMTCNRRFARSAHLHRHQRIHTGEKPFRCFKCGRSYARGDYLRSHLTCQHNQTPMPCEICGEKFETITELNDHQKLRHGRMRAWFLQPGLKANMKSPVMGQAGAFQDQHDDDVEEEDDDGHWSLCGDVDHYELDQTMSDVEDDKLATTARPKAEPASL